MGDSRRLRAACGAASFAWFAEPRLTLQASHPVSERKFGALEAPVDEVTFLELAGPAVCRRLSASLRALAPSDADSATYDPRGLSHGGALILRVVRLPVSP
jgi:hypothetical protein